MSVATIVGESLLTFIAGYLTAMLVARRRRQP